MTPIAIDAHTNLPSAHIRIVMKQRAWKTDLQRVLDEHTSTGTHHGALPEDVFLLIPFRREGEVIGHEPDVR